MDLIPHFCLKLLAQIGIDYKYLRNLDERVPPVSFTLQSRTPAEVAIHLGECEIYVWNGNFYALAVTTRLGLEGRGGLIRVGATHYNTLEEIERFGAAMRELF